MNVAAFVLASLVCGTSPETHQQTLALDARVRAHGLAALVAGATRVANDTIYVRADGETAPFDDPADLEGMSLYFARRGAGSFAVTREPLRYDAGTGPLYVAFDRATFTKTLPLPFAFPFGSGSHTQVTLSMVRGIHFTERPALPSRAFEPLEIVTAAAPLISPLFDYQGSPGGGAQAFVKQTAEAVTITFRRDLPSMVDLDVQAVLFANGDIRFSYRRVQNIAWGGVVVTTGSGSWMTERTALATIDDPAGDVEPLFGASREMLDIRSVEISRVAGSSLLELRIRTAAPIDRALLREGSSYLVFLGDSLNRIELFVFADRLQFRLPNGQEANDSEMARIDGADVVMYVAEDQLTLPGRSVKVWAYTNAFSVADSVAATIDLGAVPPSIETDLSALTSIETSRPLVEAYRLPTVNVQGVWRRLQQDLGFRDDEIDAVAIYTSFLSDIVLTRYGAFATLANPGADGVSQYSSKALPRTPTLMHMNALGMVEGHDATQVLLHELGHRWLYYFDIVEEGTKRRALNPLGYHPAQWVHTPGAFLDQASAMGGAVFADNRNGTFTTAASDARSAFTWHELYLMGLAGAEEVQPWFYVRGTSLGDEYHPPADATVSGTRVDVGIQQLVAAMGPRDPSFESSRKTFRVLFVVLERDGAPAPHLGTLRADFERAFSAATGGRGRVVTRVEAGGGRRRAVRK